MSEERRCDMHGPYSPEDAARIALGQLTPFSTDHLCPECTAAIKAAAQRLANAIDARAVELFFRGEQ